MNEIATLAAALSDRYEITREIGAGGMAAVYLARDLKHDRLVALKVLHPDLSSSLGSERFTREIRTAARLQHPNILGVFDSGESAGRLWFTMPYVDGESLRERLTREPQLPVEESVRIATEAARGLAHAHAHGVVHRDVKPENLLLTRDGSTLVADFGIARADDTAHAGLTGTGLSLGTPAYMSPEQASGERQIDARTDVYALGAVLYEMLAGEPAFSGPNLQAVIARVLTQDPRPVNPIRSAVSPAVDAVIRKAMSRTPADRYATMDAFAGALSSSVSGAVVLAGSPPRRSVLILGAIAAFVAIAVAGALMARRNAATHAELAIQAGAPSTRTAIAVLPFENRGRAEDAHIADGIADEIRGKLAGLAGLTVIARASSNEYRGNAKRQQQIASELGVTYLLSGTVQFEPDVAGRTTRLRVSAELVEIKGSATPATRWQKPFDRDLADVFAVQSDIADSVASALDLALSARQRGQLADRPTHNLEAYDAYLKGEEISRAVATTDAPTLQRALVEYNRAVLLDPTFAAAWARISRAHGIIFYWTSESIEDDSLARRAAERAIAIAPDRWEGHWALGMYLASVAHEPLHAIAELRIALRLAPGNAEVFDAMASAQFFAGEWDESLRSAGQARLLDPRAIDPYRRQGFALMTLRRYDDAIAALQRALVIDPNDANAHYRLYLLRLSQRDLPGATAALSIPGDSVAQKRALITAVAYQQIGLPLDAVLRLEPESFPGDRAKWAYARSRAYAARGDEIRSRAYADTVLIALGPMTNRSPNGPGAHRFRAWALAKLGRRAEAIAAADDAMRRLPQERDPLEGSITAYLAAQAFAMLGERERTLDVLTTLLGRRTFVQPAWIALNPVFTGLRGDPRFERLVRQ